MRHSTKLKLLRRESSTWSTRSEPAGRSPEPGYGPPFFLPVQRQFLLKTPSGQKCNLCLRYVLLPMSQGRTKTNWSALADDFRTFDLWQTVGRHIPIPTAASLKKQAALALLVKDVR
jgi:hypothetical protein